MGQGKKKMHPPPGLLPGTHLEMSPPGPGAAQPRRPASARIRALQLCFCLCRENNFIKDFPQLADGLLVIPLPVEEQCRGVLSEPLPDLQLLTGTGTPGCISGDLAAPILPAETARGLCEPAPGGQNSQK